MGYNVRTLVLFRFITHCLRSFKATFCKLALFSFNLAVECLQSESVFDFWSSSSEPASKRQKMNTDEEDESDKVSMEQKLIMVQRSNYVMDTFQLTMKYGRKEQLVDKATYLMLMPVIVQQIKAGTKLRDDLMFIAYFEKYITPTLVCLANTTKDVHLWNELNKQVLRKCGDTNKIVRSAAVDALLGLFSLMGHSWLNCLPQTLQYISELLQDNDEDVMQRTKTLVSRIELLTQSKLNNL